MKKEDIIEDYLKDIREEIFRRKNGDKVKISLVGLWHLVADVERRFKTIKKTIAIKDKEIDEANKKGAVLLQHNRFLKQQLSNCREANLRLIKDGKRVIKLEVEHKLKTQQSKAEKVIEIRELMKKILAKHKPQT